MITYLSYGKFERALDLPAGLDMDKVQAHLHDGLLDIRIPLAQAVKPKQIPISTGAPQKALAAQAGPQSTDPAGRNPRGVVVFATCYQENRRPGPGPYRDSAECSG